MAKSNFSVRVLSAAILAPVVLYLTWLGGLPFRIMAACTAAVIFYEWVGMFGRRSRGFWPPAVAVALGLVIAALLVGYGSLQFLVLIILAYIVLAVIASVSMKRGGTLSHALAFAFLYAALPAFAMISARGTGEGGMAAIIFLFAVVWATDIFAYFTGKTFGGPRLAPRISPGKTWSGAIGGTVLAAIAGFAFVSWHAGEAVWVVLPIATLLSVASQLGDLFESAAKRRAGVKDSSKLIPGHGGVLDRVDGLVVAAVCLYAIGLSLGGFDVLGEALLQR